MRAKPIQLMHVVALATASCQAAYDFDQPPVEIQNTVTTAQRTYDPAGGTRLARPAPPRKPT